MQERADTTGSRLGNDLLHEAHRFLCVKFCGYFEGVLLVPSQIELLQVTLDHQPRSSESSRVAIAIMRFSGFAVFVVLAATFVVYTQSVLVPYTDCSAAGSHVKVFNITANVWPPVKDALESISINGWSNENITSGTYEIDIYWENQKIDVITGNVCSLDACPILVGLASVVYNVTIPYSAPPGNYEIDVSANDQNKQPLFCVKIYFQFMSGGAVMQRANQFRPRLH